MNGMLGWQGFVAFSVVESFRVFACPASRFSVDSLLRVRYSCSTGASSINETNFFKAVRMNFGSAAVT